MIIPLIKQLVYAPVSSDQSLIDSFFTFYILTVKLCIKKAYNFVPIGSLSKIVIKSGYDKISPFIIQ
ncbi:hypothetical protein HNP36_000064 [Chryseobacterium shigense]|uniref:Uncharacterized protein n=1 Tax=Chryseobacterium shigense TaxID=297244 RepID=A0A841N2Q9_9FLAO|nr:hypothetical protein [Chryseobacterium shigense]